MYLRLHGRLFSIVTPVEKHYSHLKRLKDWKEYKKKEEFKIKEICKTEIGYKEIIKVLKEKDK
jgi:hypothetical protein